MENNDLLQIKPHQVRAKITISEPAKLQTKDVRLALRFEYAFESEREYQFVLNLLESSSFSEETSWFSDPTLRHRYLFKISDQSIDDFKRYQREFVKLGKPKKYYWTVYYYLAKRPPKDQGISLDLELKLSDQEDYFYLLKSAEMDIN